MSTTSEALNKHTEGLGAGAKVEAAIIQTIITTTPEKEAVLDAASWLDEMVPGWYHKIDLEKFLLIDPTRCICGQIWDEHKFERRPDGIFYFYGSGYGYFKSIYADNVSHNVLLAFMGDVSQPQGWEYKAVEKHWRDLIFARQQAA